MLLSYLQYGKDTGTDKYQWQSGKIESAMERVGDSAKNLWTGESTVLPRTITLEPYQYYIWKIEG